jgi:hypothetical protein
MPEKAGGAQGGGVWNRRMPCRARDAWPRPRPRAHGAKVHVAGCDSMWRRRMGRSCMGRARVAHAKGSGGMQQVVEVVEVVEVVGVVEVAAVPMSDSMNEFWFS